MKIINTIATSKLARKLIDKTQNSPEFYKKLNNNLPILETTVATGCYSIAIQNNKTIEKDRKPAMHYQNIICGICGITLGASLNKIIGKYKNNICKELKGRNIYKLHNVIKGVQIAIPLIIFSTFLRFIVPVLATPISTHIERIRRKHESIQNNRFTRKN